MKRILGRLLHFANSDPGFGSEKRAFYAMKDRLLNRWGTPDGHDVQRIPGKTCWTCEGTGVWEGIDTCRRCWGTGWYTSPKWVVLQRYKLGGYAFHIPRESTSQRPKPDVTNIEGYIEHPNYGAKSREAWLWLALAFDRPLWWKSIGSHSYYRWQWLPMLALNRIAMRASMFVANFRQRCRDCGGHTWGATTFVCDRCSRREAELPF